MDDRSEVAKDRPAGAGQRRHRPPGPHPLSDVLKDASMGVFPPVDGGVTYLPPLDGGLEMVLALTGHAFIASAIGPAALRDLAPDGLGAAHHPLLLSRLAGNGGITGTHDVLLSTRGSDGPPLDARTDLDDHPRVRHARSVRDGVEVFGNSSGLVTLGSGPADRLEMGLEVFDTTRGQQGGGLVTAALNLVGPDRFVYAAVAPGNARALKLFLRCGFVPLGSEVLIRPGSRPSSSAGSMRSCDR